MAGLLRAKGSGPGRGQWLFWNVHFTDKVAMTLPPDTHRGQADRRNRNQCEMHTDSTRGVSNC